MDHFECNLYVPMPGSWLEDHLLPESGIVGRDLADGLVDLWYEGNKYHAPNLESLKDKIVCAAGRMRENYPTIARVRIAAAQVEKYGTLTINGDGSAEIAISNVEAINRYFKDLRNQLGVDSVIENIEVFRFETQFGTWAWNISLALKLVAARLRETLHGGYIEVPREGLESIVAQNTYDEAVVEAADHKSYGLAVIVAEPDGDDSMQRRVVLIDGTHRAVKAYRMGLGFKAIVLTQEEHDRVVIERPAVCETGGV